MSTLPGASRFSVASEATALVVADSPDVRTQLGAILRDLRSRVDLTANGAQALARIAQCAYDLVFVDATTPRIDVNAVCNAVEESNTTRKTQVVILTSADRPADHAGTYLIKPVPSEILEAVVRDYLPASRREGAGS